jgi:hypothetical protein
MLGRSAEQHERGPDLEHGAHVEAQGRMRLEPHAAQHGPVRAPQVLDVNVLVDVEDGVPSRHGRMIEHDIGVLPAADRQSTTRRQLDADHTPLHRPDEDAPARSRQRYLLGGQVS